VPNWKEKASVLSSVFLMMGAAMLNPRGPTGVNQDNETPVEALISENSNDETDSLILPISKKKNLI